MGLGVTDLKVGDVVVVFAFDKFATFQSTSADLVQKVEKDEDVTKLASVPWSFAQAIYGLETLARVESDETVLVLSNTGAVGAAALKVAQTLSAKAFIVADSRPMLPRLLASLVLLASRSSFLPSPPRLVTTRI